MFYGLWRKCSQKNFNCGLIISIEKEGYIDPKNICPICQSYFDFMKGWSIEDYDSKFI